MPTTALERVGWTIGPGTIKTSPMGEVIPTSERQARPLAKLPAELYAIQKKYEGAPVGNDNAEKQLHQNDAVDSHPRTSEIIAKKTGVSRATVERDGKLRAEYHESMSKGHGGDRNPDGVNQHTENRSNLETQGLISPPETTAAAVAKATGRRYNRTKKAAHRPEKQLDQNDPVNPISTAAKLAVEHGASEATVKREHDGTSPARAEGRDN
jgi:hypothetical protein